jgi:hypothetical protein
MHLWFVSADINSEIHQSVNIAEYEYRGLEVTTRDDVIDGRPPYWGYFFRAARDVLMEITLQNGRWLHYHLDYTS